jgi:hypothetical protein
VDFGENGVDFGNFLVGFFRSWVNLRGLSLVSWALSFGGFVVDLWWICGGFSVDAGRLVFFRFSCRDLRSVLDAFRILRVLSASVDCGSSVLLWVSFDFGLHFGGADVGGI